MLLYGVLEFSLKLGNLSINHVEKIGKHASKFSVGQAKEWSAQWWSVKWWSVSKINPILSGAQNGEASLKWSTF